MSIIKLKEFPPEPSPRFPPKQPCEAHVNVTPGHDMDWRKRRYGDRWQHCHHDAVATIDGKNYCRRHAGFIASDKWLAGKLIERDDAGLCG